MKFPARLLPFLLLLDTVRAEIPAATADLGQGLGYVRIHSSAEADKLLAPLAAKDAALVVDLRYPTDELANYDAVRQQLERHPAGHPLFLLVSADTPPGEVLLVKAMATRSLVLGPTNSWVPENHGVLVAQTAEADRQAYNAYEAGQPVADLISGRIEKDRYDEAALMTDFRGGNTDPQPPSAPDPTKPKTTPDAAPRPVPTDRVLQRAVHLHHALLALPPQG